MKIFVWFLLFLMWTQKLGAVEEKDQIHALEMFFLYLR